MNAPHRLEASRTVLVPMTADEFAAYTRTIAAEYAADNVTAGRWPASEAVAGAQAQLDALLPQGLATPAHWLWLIRDDTLACSVGQLWFAVEGEGDARAGYLYNIRIEPEFRGRGYASGALGELERVAREWGLPSIGLHVFAFNTTAQALYRSLGWGITGLVMRKPLQP